MCPTCPFRGADDSVKRSCATVRANDWPCHTEDIYGDAGVQCRGHYEAVRKFSSLNDTEKPVMAETTLDNVKDDIRQFFAERAGERVGS